MFLPIFKLFQEHLESAYSEEQVSIRTVYNCKYRMDNLALPLPRRVSSTRYPSVPLIWPALLRLAVNGNKPRKKCWEEVYSVCNYEQRPSLSIPAASQPTE
jgi:hypothetical protein